MATERTGFTTVTGVEFHSDYVKADSNIITIISAAGTIVPRGVLVSAVCGAGSLNSNTIDIDVDDTTYNHYGVELGGDRNTINGSVIDMYNNNAKDLGIYIAGWHNVGRANETYRCGTGITDAGTGNDVDGLDT